VGPGGLGSVAPPPDPLGWVALELVDQDGKPAAMVRWQVVTGDGATRTGLTDSEGKARVDDLPAGDATVTFPDLHAGEWEPT